MLTKDKIIEIFCIADDFCKNFSQEIKKHQIKPKDGKKIKELLPDCAISTDIIAGFYGETEQDHIDTLSLMKEVGYEYAFMFKYSVREGTKAAEKFEDDISEELKIKRLEEIIAWKKPAK
jgi:tRNA A37 methylthiotransferase MiaB